MSPPIWGSRPPFKTFLSWRMMEALVMGVQWHTSLVGEKCGDSVRMVNIDTFGQPMTNPLETTEDKAEEDNILDDSN